MELHTKRFNLTTKKGKNFVEVYDFRMANKLNKLLGTYDEKIKSGEEPIFSFTDEQFPAVAKILNIGHMLNYSR